MTALRTCIECGDNSPILPGERTWPLGASCDVCGTKPVVSDGIVMFAPELAGTRTGMDPVSFDKLIEVEADHFWFVARNELIVALARKLFPVARSYLEIGCGNGMVLDAIRRSRAWDRVVGTELHPAGLDHARRRMPSDVEFVQLDARNIPVRDAFDLVGAFDVLEHIPDEETVMRGLRDAMTAGGGILVTVPQHPWLWSGADDFALHQRRYRRGELEGKLQRNGFKVIFSTSYTALLFPLMAASRLTDRSNAKDYDPMREFKIDARLNAALKFILRAEVKTIMAGIRWPFGGSRIVAAVAA